jgi:hypothetical protein
VANDGSDDATAAVVGIFADAAGVRLVPGIGRTCAAARNAGAAASSGRVLCFVDADSIVPENAADRILELHEGEGRCLVLYRLASREPGMRAWLWWTFWGLARHLPVARAKSMPAFMSCDRSHFETYGPFDMSFVTAEEWPLTAAAYRYHHERFLYDRSLTRAPPAGEWSCSRSVIFEHSSNGPRWSSSTGRAPRPSIAFDTSRAIDEAVWCRMRALRRLRIVRDWRSVPTLSCAWLWGGCSSPRGTRRFRSSARTASVRCGSAVCSTRLCWSGSVICWSGSWIPECGSCPSGIGRSGSAGSTGAFTVLRSGSTSTGAWFCLASLERHWRPCSRMLRWRSWSGQRPSNGRSSPSPSSINLDLLTETPWPRT